MAEITTSPGTAVGAHPSSGWEPLPIVGTLSEPVAVPLAERLRTHHPVTAAVAVLVSCYLLLAALTFAVGKLLLDVLLANGRGQWDVIGWNRWFNVRFDHTMDTWTGWLSRMANTTTVVAIAAVLVVGFLIARRWQAALFIMSALTLEVSVFLTTTLLIDRARPDLPKPDQVPPTSSYPSGHTAAGTALYLAIALVIAAHIRNRVARTVVALLGLLPGVLVAVGRVARSMHHPTDVMTGYVLGLLCVLSAAVIVSVTTRVAAAHQAHQAHEAHDVAAGGARA